MQGPPKHTYPPPARTPSAKLNDSLIHLLGRETYTDSMEEVTKAFKKVNSTVPAELSLSSSLLEDSSYSSSDSESHSSHAQDKQAMHSESSSLVIQVDVHDAKDQPDVQHVSGDNPDTAEDNGGAPQENFAMDTDRPMDCQDSGGQSLAKTPQVQAKMPSVPKNPGAVGSCQSSQCMLGGWMHLVPKEVPLTAHSRPSSMPASTPQLDDICSLI